MGIATGLRQVMSDVPKCPRLHDVVVYEYGLLKAESIRPRCGTIDSEERVDLG